MDNQNLNLRIIEPYAHLVLSKILAHPKEIYEFDAMYKNLDHFLELHSAQDQYSFTVKGLLLGVQGYLTLYKDPPVERWYLP